MRLDYHGLRSAYGATNAFRWQSQHSPRYSFEIKLILLGFSHRLFVWRYVKGNRSPYSSSLPHLVRRHASTKSHTSVHPQFFSGDPGAPQSEQSQLQGVETPQSSNALTHSKANSLFEPVDHFKTVAQTVESTELSNLEATLAGSESWTIQIAELAKRFDPNLRRYAKNISHNCESLQIIPDWLLFDQQSHYFHWRKLWLSNDHSLRSRLWSSVMLWYLQNDVSLALKFVKATTIRPLPASYQIADVLDIAVSYIDAIKEPDTRIAQFISLNRTLLFILRRFPDKFPISQRTLKKLNLNIDSDARYELFQTMQACNTYIEPNLLLHFSRKFMDKPDQWEKCMEALSTAVKLCGPDQRHLIDHNVCMAFLRGAVALSPELNVQVISYLAQMGVTFTTELYTVLIANASDRGEYQTAWQIFDSLSEAGLSPDGVLFSILLKLCRRSNDFHSFRYLFNIIRKFAEDGERQDLNPVLVTELLFSYFAWGTRRFKRLFLLYRHYFDIQPLAALGLIPDADPQTLSAKQYHDIQFVSNDGLPFYGPKPPPNPLALAIMVLISLRTRNRGIDAAVQVYQRFKECLKAKHPVIIALAGEPIIWDIFLMSFTARKETLPMWQDVLRDMAYPPHLYETTPAKTGDRNGQKREPVAAGENTSSTNSSTRHPMTENEPSENDIAPRQVKTTVNRTHLKPSQMTWNILLRGFLKHERLDLAEKIFDIMVRQGFIPGDQTWNTMIQSWSVTGQKDKVMNGLERMQVDGWELNEPTVRAIKGEPPYPLKGRTGLGKYALGGGLQTGPRLGSGGFELV